MSLTHLHDCDCTTLCSSAFRRTVVIAGLPLGQGVVEVPHPEHSLPGVKITLLCLCGSRTARGVGGGKASNNTAAMNPMGK